MGQARRRATSRASRLVINPIISAELLVTHDRIEALESLLPDTLFAREPLPRPAAFLAGNVFVT